MFESFSFAFRNNEISFFPRKVICGVKVREEIEQFVFFVIYITFEKFLGVVFAAIIKA